MKKRVHLNRGAFYLTAGGSTRDGTALQIHQLRHHPRLRQHLLQRRRRELFPRRGLALLQHRARSFRQ